MLFEGSFCLSRVVFSWLDRSFWAVPVAVSVATLHRKLFVSGISLPKRFVFTVCCGASEEHSPQEGGVYLRWIFLRV